ncbi:MAG: oligosaccharide flippase family protein [Crenarchaeota archaeon]|nr:oligosaccharide flippase family protein [Thermoproteota archaeon]
MQILEIVKNSKTSLQGFIKSESGLIYTTLGNLGSSLMGGIFWLILASILDVASYGLINYYIALASVFAAVALLGLDATVITFMAKGETRIWFEANSLLLISGLAVTIVLSVFEWSSGILSIVMVFFMMALAEALGRKKYRQYAFLSIGQRVVQIVMSFLLFGVLGLLGIVLGYFLGNLVFSYKSIQSLPNFTLKLESIKEKRNFALHSYGSNLIKNFNTNLDKVLIAPVFGYFTLGLYQLGFQFFMFLSIIPLSLYYYLLPEEASGKNKTKIKFLGFGFAVIAGVTAFFFTPYIIERLFPSFINSILIVRIMCLAIIPQTVVLICNASLLGNGKSNPVFVAGLIYISVLLILLFVLGSFFGPIGLAFTLIIAQTVQASYLVIKYR